MALAPARHRRPQQPRPQTFETRIETSLELLPRFRRTRVRQREADSFTFNQVRAVVARAPKPVLVGRPPCARPTWPRQGPRAGAGMIRVKICGITNGGDAGVAVEAPPPTPRVFIFVEGTPRVRDARAGRADHPQAPPRDPGRLVLGSSRRSVKAVAEAAGCAPPAVPRRRRPPEDLAGYALPVIKTIKMAPASTLEDCGVPHGRSLADPALPQRGLAILLDSAARWSEGEPASRSSGRWRGRCRVELPATTDHPVGGLTPARPRARSVRGAGRMEST